MPKRSTFVGGPPQFGQLRATGPCWPAGTIGCWIGGGGGIVRRLEADDSAMMMKMMTNRNGTQRNGANPSGKNGEEPVREDAMTEKARIPNTQARTRPMTKAWSVARPAAGAQYASAGRGGGWATAPNWASLR